MHLNVDVEGYRPQRGETGQLGNFIDPEVNPVIVTKSHLLSTGVDAQTCRLIVLDREIGSMTEFKQIVGRGTRVHEDTKKYYFTLIDRTRGISRNWSRNPCVTLVARLALRQRSFSSAIF